METCVHEHRKHGCATYTIVCTRIHISFAPGPATRHYDWIGRNRDMVFQDFNQYCPFSQSRARTAGRNWTISPRTVLIRIKTQGISSCCSVFSLRALILPEMGRAMLTSPTQWRVCGRGSWHQPFRYQPTESLWCAPLSVACALLMAERSDTA